MLCVLGIFKTHCVADFIMYEIVFISNSIKVVRSRYQVTSFFILYSCMSYKKEEYSGLLVQQNY